MKPSQASPPAIDTADALTAVVNSATAVARAELRLAAAEARAWLTRIGVGLVMLWLSLLLLQVCVLLFALLPVFAQNHHWTMLALMMFLALVPTVSVALFARRELKRLKD